MKVQDLMVTNVATCGPNDDLNRAAQIMWENDCGVVPILDAESRVVGMLTDRDICMAAYTQGRALWQIPVSSVCSGKVEACTLGDSIQAAEKLMRAAQVRRLPVVDGEGKLWGLISLGDLAQHVHRGGRKPDGLSYESVAGTLAAISRPPLEGNGASDAVERAAQQGPSHRSQIVASA